MLTCLYSSRIPEKVALHQAGARCAAGELSAQDAAVTPMLLGRMWLLQKAFPRGLISSKQPTCELSEGTPPDSRQGRSLGVGGG